MRSASSARGRSTAHHPEAEGPQFTQFTELVLGLKERWKLDVGPSECLYMDPNLAINSGPGTM